ncbi:hypothetical protein [Stackebrandtia nassauensis]|uniref:Uncharacterized protein n=1 Tax=Stackebrandtia nassauensis (strain DSM 44728 / CIP 108903 / NRRL B-16338 / NBRC 102104 / LLR-40K-21) TaxID=446470 RepID=D3Q2E2_STANL|nr:hypothetical protein [Stackebrandtia nassauensis]ADD43875.1 hypothetical protein Snas_4226 [Stackebrandtia nassauensis DSM 44728]
MPTTPGTTPEDAATGTGATGEESGTLAEVPPEPPAAASGTTPAATGTTAGDSGTSGDAPPPPAPAPADSPPEAPPWERTGQPFDAETAWKLITNLRAEVARGKAGAPTGPGGTDELAQRVTSLEQQLAEERAAARARIGEQHQMPEPVVALLGDGDGKTLAARAQALIDWAHTLNRPAPSRGARRRPVAELRSGTTPEQPPEDTDPARLAAQVAARRPHY